jgi:hypothetical protein
MRIGIAADATGGRFGAGQPASAARVASCRRATPGHVDPLSCRDMQPTYRAAVLCLALTAMLATACNGASSGSTAQRGSASRPAVAATTHPAPTSSAPLPTFDACDVVTPAVFARFADLPAKLTGDTSGRSSASSTCTYRVSGFAIGSVTVQAGALVMSAIARDVSFGATRLTGLGDEADGFALGKSPAGEAAPATGSSVTARRGQRLIGANCPMPLAECRDLVAYALTGRRGPVPRRTTLDVASSACAGVEQILGAAVTDALRATIRPTDAAAKRLSDDATRLRARPRAAPGAAIARSLAAEFDSLAYYVDVFWPLHHTPRAQRARLMGQMLGAWYDDALTPMVRTCGNAWLRAVATATMAG